MSDQEIIPTSPPIVFLVGFMAAGKTTLGKAAAKKAGWDFQDLDDLIESQEMGSIPTLFEEKGEPYFREVEQQVLRIATAELTHPLLLSCGGGTPCYGNNMVWMNQRGITVYLATPFEILLGRLRTMRAQRPMLSHIPETGLKAYMEDLIRRREPFYLQAQHILRGETLTIQGLVNILKASETAS